MAFGHKDRIHPLVHDHREAIRQEMLRASLAHASIEVACDDNWIASSLFTNHCEHILSPSEAFVSRTCAAVATMNTPVGIEMPKGASAGMSQLRPCDKPWPPLTRSTDVSTAFVADCE